MVLTFIDNDSAAPDDASRRLRKLEERMKALEERIMRRRKWRDSLFRIARVDR